MKPNEAPKFICAVFFVKDIEISKEFYQNVLGQKIMMDHGENVLFEGGLSLWNGDYALETIGLKNTEKTPLGRQNSEIYFESGDLDKLYEKIKKEKEKIEFIHKIKEQPWGQRAFRIYDPDGHIVEFGEPMSAVIIRFKDQNMTPEEISKRTSMPLDIVKTVLGE